MLRKKVIFRWSKMDNTTSSRNIFRGSFVCTPKIITSIVNTAQARANARKNLAASNSSYTLSHDLKQVYEQACRQKKCFSKSSHKASRKNKKYFAMRKMIHRKSVVWTARRHWTRCVMIKDQAAANLDRYRISYQQYLFIWTICQ